MTTNVFVYGTLAPGGEAWPVLARWVAGAGMADAVAGTLFDTGRGYPAATFDPDAPDRVHGVVVPLDEKRDREALAAIDDYEGPEYERIIVTTASGVAAFAYAWIGPVPAGRPVPGGRWTIA